MKKFMIALLCATAFSSVSHADSLLPLGHTQNGLLVGSLESLKVDIDRNVTMSLSVLNRKDILPSFAQINLNDCVKHSGTIVLTRPNGTSVKQLWDSVNHTVQAKVAKKLCILGKLTHLSVGSTVDHSELK
jgi:hypothetical protein